MESEANDRLIEAVRRGDVAGIAAALLAGADPNAVVQNLTPLQRAALGDHVAVIGALLSAGARVDGADSYSTTPLMYAALYGRTAAVDALLAAGADIHHQDSSGYTALHYTSSNGHLDGSRMLLEAGARMDVRDKRGERPIDVVRVPAC
jgi:ankyrin repeat protein